MATAAPETPQLLTPGRIATRLAVPLHRVTHVLRTRAHIRPRARAGTLRLYGEDAVAQIRHELHTQDARRATVSRRPKKGRAR